MRCLEARGQVVVRAGEPYYAGGTVPTIARDDILAEPFAVDEQFPQDAAAPTETPHSSMTANFLNSPGRTGGVTGFLD